jgi:hypothetical protein
MLMIGLAAVVGLPLPSSCLLGYEKVDTTKAEFGRFQILKSQFLRIFEPRHLFCDR